jgi:hypothetical protein
VYVYGNENISNTRSQFHPNHEKTYNKTKGFLMRSKKDSLKSFIISLVSIFDVTLLAKIRNSNQFIDKYLTIYGIEVP